MTDYFRPDYTPEWFHLESYEPLKDVGRVRLQEIIRGKSILYHWETFLFKRGDSLQIDDGSSAAFKRFVDIEFLRSLPIDTAELEAVRELHYWDFFELLEASELSKDRGVQCFNRHVEDIKNSLSDADYRNGVDWKDVFDFMTDDFNFFSPIPLTVEREIIAIDLTHNDDKIIDDMREWLKAQRGNQAKKRLSDNDIKKIVDNQVIPCMDLLFWGQLSKIEYTNAQLGDMLFPNADFDRAEKVRKTTRKEAVKYLATKAYSHIL